MFQRYRCPRCNRRAMLRILPRPSTEEVCDECYERIMAGPQPRPRPEPLMESPYKAFRADGWPLCPECGEDELYSLIWFEGPRPALAEFIASIEGCYACRWRPRA